MHIRMSATLFLICLFLPIFSYSAEFQKVEVLNTGPEEQKVMVENTSDSVFALENFLPYQGNRVYVDYFRGEELDGALDVLISFQYLLTDAAETRKKDSDWQLSVLFAHEFDFYASSRYSGPVVGRRYNIGAQVLQQFSGSTGWIQSRYSIEHESNGRSTSANHGGDSATLRSIAVREYNKEKIDHPEIPFSYFEEMATETVSRGSDFWSIGGVYRANLSNENVSHCNFKFLCFDTIIKARVLIGEQEDHVFWMDPEHALRLKHFQGTQIALHTRFTTNRVNIPFVNISLTENKQFSLVYRTGGIFDGKVFDNSTWDLNFQFELAFPKNTYWLLGLNDKELKLPIILGCHTGYLEDLYQYSEKDSFCRAGFHANF